MSGTDTVHLGAERAPFVMLPTWLLRSRAVSDGAKVLYGMLHDLVAGREGPTKAVTRGELAECCGVSVDTVDRRLGELIRAGAVEKQAQFETRQGQLANVYWVRLSPPTAAMRPPVENPGGSGPTPRAADVRPPQPRPCGDPRRNGAAPTVLKEQDQELPPQPPRTAGGPEAPQPKPQLPVGPGRRGQGTSLRAAGLNPRAEADRVAEAERQAALKRRQAELAADAARRQAQEDRARREAEAFTAEALALSGVLDDDRLDRITQATTAGMARPLQRSPLAVTHAVVRWCRAAAAAHPGTPFADAIDLALAAGLDPEADDPPALVLPSPAAGTRPLRDRLTTLAHVPTMSGAKP